MPKRELSFEILAVAKLMEDECDVEVPFYPKHVAKFVGMMFMLSDHALHLEAEICALKGIPHPLNKPRPKPVLAVIAGTDHEGDAQ